MRLCSAAAGTLNCGDSAVAVAQSKSIYAALLAADTDFGAIAAHRERSSPAYEGRMCVGALELDSVFRDVRGFMLTRLKWCDWWLGNYERIRPGGSRGRTFIAYGEKPARSVLDTMKREYERAVAAAKDSAEVARLWDRFDRDTFALLEPDRYIVDPYYPHRTLHAFKQVLLTCLHMELCRRLASLDPDEVDKRALAKSDSAAIYYARPDWLADAEPAVSLVKSFPVLTPEQKYTVLAGEVATVGADPALRGIIARDRLLAFLAGAVSLGDEEVADTAESADDIVKAEAALERYVTMLGEFRGLNGRERAILSLPPSNLFASRVGYATPYRYPEKRFYVRAVRVANRYFDFILRNEAAMSAGRVAAFRKAVGRFHRRNRDYLASLRDGFGEELETFRRFVEEH